MSIIGTRPPLISETNLYELHHRARLAIKPGITGMWQVSGRSDITDFEEVVRLDKEYITNWNIGLDIKILLKDFCLKECLPWDFYAVCCVPLTKKLPTTYPHIPNRSCVVGSHFLLCSFLYSQSLDFF